MNAPEHSFGSPISGAWGGGLRPVALVLALAFLASCAAPTRESMRPRGLDVWVEAGHSRFDDLGATRTTARDWSGGLNLHFDLVYQDEIHSDEE